MLTIVILYWYFLPFIKVNTRVGIIMQQESRNSSKRSLQIWCRRTQERLFSKDVCLWMGILDSLSKQKLGKGHACHLTIFHPEYRRENDFLSHLGEQRVLPWKFWRGPQAKFDHLPYPQLVTRLMEFQLLSPRISLDWMVTYWAIPDGTFLYLYIRNKAFQYKAKTCKINLTILINKSKSKVRSRRIVVS